MNPTTTKRLGILPTLPAHALRGISLLALLGVELLTLTLGFDTQRPTGAAPRWAGWLGYAPTGLYIGLAGGAAFLVLLGPRLPTLWQTMCTSSRHHRWGLWLAGHLVACGGFTCVTAALLAGEPAAVPPSLLWPVVWMGSGATVLLLWLGTLATPRFWWHLASQEAAAVLAASLVGVGAWGAGQLSQALWAPLAQTTFWVVGSLLRLVYPEVHSYPAEQVVGTATFEVAIAPACSGYEGVGCVMLLLTLYLWLFRAHLRFPQALMLLPLGALASWVANALRLTALVALGTSVSPALAQGGFHSQAGWIAFLLVGLGVMTVTQRCALFTVLPPAPAIPAHAQYATALLGPLVVLMATRVLTAAVSSGGDWLYPMRVVTTGLALWACRQGYRRLAWTWSWHALGWGIAVWGVWLVLEPAAPPRSLGLAERLVPLPPGLIAVWIGFRVLGSVLIIPVAEELAFRSYVLPKLVATDFPAVRPSQCTWWACLLSSVLFGVLHGRWLAGTLAGLGYALALRQRGHLAAAVVAHMTTNALIAAYVLSQHAWSLWL